MANETVTARNEESVPHTSTPPVAADDAATAPPRAVRFASREEVEHAAEKIFRLHARLFEELAK